MRSPTNGPFESKDWRFRSWVTNGSDETEVVMVGSGLCVAAGMFISTPLSSYPSHSYIIIFVLFSTLAAAHGGFFPHQTRFIRFTHTVSFALSALSHTVLARGRILAAFALSAFAHGSRTQSLSGSFRSQRFCTRFSHMVAFWQLSLSALLHTVLVRGCFLAAFALSALLHMVLACGHFLAAFALSAFAHGSHVVASWQLLLSQCFRTRFLYAVTFLQLLLFTVLSHMVANTSPHLDVFFAFNIVYSSCSQSLSWSNRIAAKMSSRNGVDFNITRSSDRGRPRVAF